MQKTFIAFSVFFLGTLPLAAQTLQIGALGGVTATSPDAFRRAESKRYVIGPSVELRVFGAKLGIELDALYRRVGDSYAGELSAIPPEYTGPPPVTRFYVRSRTNSWEFPMLGKYYFRGRDAHWRPFLGTGYVLRVQTRKTESTTYVLGDNTPRNNQDSSTSGLDIGGTAVAGVELKGIRRFSFQPQVRYTRWGNHSSFSRPLNHVDIALGIRF